MNRLTPIHFMGTGASIALVAAAYLIGVRSVMSHHASAATVEAAQVREQATADELDAQIATAEAELAAAKAEIAAAPLKIGDSADLNRRLSDVSRLAQLHQIEVGAMGVGDPTVEAGCHVSPISFNGSGPFDEVVAFMRDLQRTLPDVVIEDFSVSGNSSNPNGRVQVMLSLAWYTVDALPR